jgi:hypothetical protein
MSKPEDKPAPEPPENPAAPPAAKPPEPATATKPAEHGGPQGPEPTRYGDWERNGRCSDF